MQFVLPRGQASWPRIRTATAGAVVVLAVAAAGCAADDPRGSSDVKDPELASPLTTATPTATINQQRTSDIEAARGAVFVSAGLQALDRALARGDAEAVANAWVTETASCFVGSDRTGGFCEGLGGEAGTRHEVELVHMDLWGVDLRADRGRELLHELLDGNSASLVFIASWPPGAGDLILGYAIPPRDTADFVDMRYLYLVVSADGAVRYLGPLHQTPLEEWRNFDRSPDELIAIADSIAP